MSHNWIAALAVGVAVWVMVPPPALVRLNVTTQQVQRQTPQLRQQVAQQLARWLPSFAPGRRRALILEAESATVCDLVASSLDAGRPPRGALRVVAEVMNEPTRGVLQGVLHQIDVGVDEAQAWASLASTPGYAGIARDISRSVHSGVGLAELLRHHAAEARRSRAAQAEATARTAGVRSVIPLVLCFLPAFVLLGIVPIFGGLLG